MDKASKAAAPTNDVQILRIRTLLFGLRHMRDDLAGNGIPSRDAATLPRPHKGGAALDRLSTPERVSLTEIASEVLKHARLRGRLDPFGHDFHAKRLRELQDIFDDGEVYAALI